MNGAAQQKRRPTKGQGMVKAPKKHGAPMSDSLQRLGNAIEQIQQHNASKLSFEEHYRYAYNLVLHKQGHQLYNKVAELITEHLERETKEKVVPNFPPSTSATFGQSGNAGAAANVTAAAAGQLFLDAVRGVWDEHMACMSKLRDVLKYMDKMYTGSIHLPNVWDLGLSLFFHHVVLFSTDPKPKPAASASRQAASTSTSTSLPTSDPTTVAHHLIRTLLDQIRIEREGEVVSRHSLQANTELLGELTDEGPVPLPVTASAGTGAGTPVLGVGSGGTSARNKPVMGVGVPGDQASPYQTSFEKAFLKQTEEFYTKESAALLVECDAPTFLQKIARRLDEEATRAQSYLAPATEVQLAHLLEKVLITANIQAVLEHPSSGLATLIADSRIRDLELMYQLFGRVTTGRPALQAGLSAWIVETGKKVNAGLLITPAAGEAEEEVEMVDPKGKGKARAAPSGDGGTGAKTKAALAWVQSVLDLKDKFDVLLKEAFASDTETEKTINAAFTIFVNENPKSPEYMSLFVDENLKKGLKGKTEEEVDAVLDKSIALFRFLTEKDQFETYYNRHLSRRLINNRSVSDDAERRMLDKFKREAGVAFTKNAEGMMKDVKVSEDSQPEFKRFQERQINKLPYEMITTVGGSNNWPFVGDASCNLPDALLKGVEAYRAFYNGKHSGRKLTFRADLGSVDVKARFKARTHELNVSTFSMVVLALFESTADNESLSYGQIADATKMGSADLRRTLQSLACAKFKILAKEPKGKDVNDSDKFYFNSGFTCPLAKIKIQVVANKVENSDERKETEVRLEEERHTLCDACIVRVMKDRKVLPHMELVNEVIRQVSHRFQPRPAMIKQAIERMIEKEYLERSETDRRQLSYIA